MSLKKSAPRNASIPGADLKSHLGLNRYIKEEAQVLLTVGFEKYEKIFSYKK